MLVGMGTVFFFLTLLVFATALMSTLVQRFVPAEEMESVDQDHIAAIAAAITQHRRAQGRQETDHK